VDAIGMATVLVIDDEPLVQMALADLLEEARHTAILARAGRSALDDLAAGGYDLVITDLNMPEVSGWDVARWMATHRPEVPVIAISGRIVEGLDDTWLKRFSAFLAKPLDETVLLDHVARLAPV